MKVRLKKGTIEGVFYGRCIYPGDNWVNIDDKYKNLALKDSRLEFFSEDNKAKVENVVEQSIEPIDKKVETNETIDENVAVYDPLTTKILGLHWTKAKQEISEMDDIDYLKNTLLPVVTLKNAKALINAVNDRIQQLEG